MSEAAGGAPESEKETSDKQQQQKIFHPGQMIDGKWRIKAVLGKGACGVVYKVEDKIKKGWSAAMKIEYISQDYDQTLRLEIGVLNKLKNIKDMLQLIDFGRRKTFTYMVTTLCGKDLMALRCKIKRGFNDSSALRIAVFTLYGLKQTHENGYVHRDVKPGNVITAAKSGRDSRVLLLIDFGMARSFVTTDKDGKKSLRVMRKKIPLRGTIRYCSLNVHDRLEQGRCDDLVAMMYMLVEVTLGVPWHHLKEEVEVQTMKKATKDADLFEELPEELKLIFEYVKSLTYNDRPCYLKIYNLLMTAIKRLKINFLDPYEWEDEEIEKDLKMEKEKAAKEEQLKKEEEKNKKGSIPVDNEKDAEVKKKKKNENETGAMNADSNLKTSSDVVSNHKIGSKDSARSDSKTSLNLSVADQSENRNLNTAIDYDPSELKTKKALSREDLQFAVYPSISLATFSENVLSF